MTDCVVCVSRELVTYELDKLVEIIESNAVPTASEHSGRIKGNGRDETDGLKPFWGTGR
jgi:hypothetical protein